MQSYFNIIPHIPMLIRHTHTTHPNLTPKPAPLFVSLIRPFCATDTFVRKHWQSPCNCGKQFKKPSSKINTLDLLLNS